MTIQSGRDVERLALEDPEEYARLLEGYRLLIGSSTEVADAAEAIDAADHGAAVFALEQHLDDPEFHDEFRSALREVRWERARRDEDRASIDRCAAALLATARIHGVAKRVAA